MTTWTTPPPWEPPAAGTETEHLVGMLERLRTTFRWKADGLDDDQLRTRLGASALTLGSLLKHLALVEDDVFGGRFSGTPVTDTWDMSTWDGPGWEFRSAAGDPAAHVYGLWDAAVARSRERLVASLADGGLDRPGVLQWDDGTRPSLRRHVCDLVEEYGRHTGHADLLREAVDGRVGEDVPPGWAPVS
ncbi:MAG: hypothetical protein JWR20_2599 [Marmoricola sp.]|nr:hypothetical protein [Marmoricola sp.]